MSRVRAWTDEEVGFLLDNEDRTARWIADELGRGRQSVQKMRQKLRNGGEPMAVWTEDEDAFILEHPDFTASQLASHLGRTKAACVVRRGKLGHGLAQQFRHRKEPNAIGDRTLLAKSCTKCGLLLTPKWFGRQTNGLWRTACVRCSPKVDRTPEYERRKAEGRTPADRAFVARMQAITVPVAHKSGQEWTSAEFEVLADPERTALTKALELGRTYNAVIVQCSRNGFRSLVGHGDPIKGRWVIDNPNEPAREAVAA